MLARSKTSSITLRYEQVGQRYSDDSVAQAAGGTRTPGRECVLQQHAARLITSGRMPSAEVCAFEDNSENWHAAP